MSTRTAFLAAAFASLLVPGLLRGQDEEDTGDFDPVTVPTSREVDILLGEIDRRARSNDWRAVAERLQAILERHAERVVDAGSPGEDRVAERYLGAREFVRQKAALLGRPALEAYQSLYDPFAAEILSRATEGEGRLRALRDILLRYPLVTKAQEYRGELANHHLEKGEFEESIAWLRQAARWGGQETPAALLAKLAFALRGRGDVAGLESLAEMAEPRLGERVEAGGRKGTLGDLLERAREEARAGLGLAREVERWPTLGANGKRDWRVEGETSLAPVSWSSPIPSPEVPIDVSRYAYEDASHYREFAYSPHYPIVVGGEVFLSNGISISRYNLYNGTRQDFFAGLVESVVTPQEPHLGYGLTSHGGHLYANLEGPTEQKYERWQQFQIQVPIPRRHLVKISIDQEKLVWDASDPRGKEDDPDLEFIEEASIAGEPVVFGDTVFAVANHFEGMNKSYLVAIDDATGRIRYKTLLSTGQEELNMFGRPVKELVGTVVASESGVLYALTNVGVVCAVDALDGRILWLSRYERIRLPITRYARVQRRDPSWGNCPPLLASGALVVAPMDSWYAYAFDATSGRKLWESRLGQEYKYLLTVYQDRVIFGGESLLAVDLSSGRPLWRPPVALSTGDSISGHGVMVGDDLLVPGNSFLYLVNPLAGKVVERRRWENPDQERGHLLFVDDILLSAGREHLTGYTDSEHSLANLERTLAKNPGDPGIRFKLGSLLLRLGRTDQAVEHFQRLLAEGRADLADESERFWAGKASDALFGTYLELATRAGRPEDAERYYRLARDVVTDVTAEVRLLFQLAAHYASRRRTEEAILSYGELSEKHGERHYYDPAEGNYVRVGLKAQVDLATHLESAGRYAQAVAAYQTALARYPEARYLALSGRELARRRIAQLIEKRGREVYRAIEEEARRIYEQAVRADAAGELQRILEEYPNSAVLEECSFTLAELLFRQNQFERASFQMQDFLRHFPGSLRRPAARVYLVRAFEEQGMLSIAKAVLRRLAEEDAGTKAVVGGEEIEVDRFVEERKNRPEYVKVEAAEAPRRVAFGPRREPVWTREPDAPRGIQNLFAPAGSPAEGKPTPVYAAIDGDLLAFSSEDGTPLWPQPLQFATGILGMRYFEGNLLVWATDRVVAIDQETGRLVWEDRRDNYVAGMGAGEGFVAITVQTTGRDQRQALSLLDSSGKGVWQTEDLPGMASDEPIVARGRVVVWSRQPAGLHLYDFESGRRVEAFSSKEDFNLPPCSPVLVGGQTILATPDRGRLLAYDLGAMKVIWEARIGAIQRDSLVANQMFTVVTNSEQGRHEVYETLSGRLVQSIPVGRGANPKHWRLDLDRLYLLVETSAAGSRRDESILAYDLGTGDLLWRSELLDPNQHQSRFEVTADSIIAVSDEKPMGSAETYRTWVFVIAKDGGKKVRQMELETNLPLYSSSGIVGGRFIIARGSRIHAYGGD